MQQTSLFPCFVLAAKSGPPSIWNHYPSLDAAEYARKGIPSDSAGGGPDGYEAVSLEEFLARRRKYYLTLIGGLEEITFDAWDFNLRAFPPLRREHAKGVERFLCPEFLDSAFTRQYARRGKCFFTKIVDADDASTWINSTLIDDYLDRTAESE